MRAWTQLLEPGPALATLCIVLVFAAQTYAAPTSPEQDAEQSTEIEYYPVADATGCYYNFQHYDEGDRIITNEPCLNCTCHNRMLMCYLRVCPFTKAIGANCKVEKRADQCCPVITCPEVPVHLLTSTAPSTALGHLNEYGCSIDNLFYSDGARVPSNPENPCELCYCIRNKTACVMQECTLKVDGCRPVFQEGVCCPVRYNCEHPDYLEGPTTPQIATTTTTETPTTTLQPFECDFHGQRYNDGELVKKDIPCEKCYCMRGDIVCAVQECGPTPLDKVNCTALPVREGQCCPDTYDCAGVIEEELTTLSSVSYETEPTTISSEEKAQEVTLQPLTTAQEEERQPEAGTESSEAPEVITKAAVPEETQTERQQPEEGQKPVDEEAEGETTVPEVVEEITRQPAEAPRPAEQATEKSTEETTKPQLEEVTGVQQSTEGAQATEEPQQVTRVGVEGEITEKEPVTIVTAITPETPAAETPSAPVEEIPSEKPTIEEESKTTESPVESFTGRVTEAIESITSRVTEAVEAITSAISGSSTEQYPSEKEGTERGEGEGTELPKEGEVPTEGPIEEPVTRITAITEEQPAFPTHPSEAGAPTEQPESDKAGVTPAISDKERPELATESPEEEKPSVTEVPGSPEKEVEPEGAITTEGSGEIPVTQPSVEEQPTTIVEEEPEEHPVHDEVEEHEAEQETDSPITKIKSSSEPSLAETTESIAGATAGPPQEETTEPEETSEAQPESTSVPEVAIETSSEPPSKTEKPTETKPTGPTEIQPAITEQAIVPEKCDEQGCARIPTAEIQPSTEQPTEEATKVSEGTEQPATEEQPSSVPSEEASERPTPQEGQTEAGPAKTEQPLPSEETSEPATTEKQPSEIPEVPATQQPSEVVPEQPGTKQQPPLPSEAATEQPVEEQRPETEAPEYETKTEEKERPTTTEAEEVVIVTEIPTKKTELPESMDHVSETAQSTEAPRETVQPTAAVEIETQKPEAGPEQISEGLGIPSTEGPSASEQPEPHATIPGEGLPETTESGTEAEGESEQPTAETPSEDEQLVVETKATERPSEAQTPGVTEPIRREGVGEKTTELPREEDNEIEHEDTGVTGPKTTEAHTAGKIPEPEATGAPQEQPTSISAEPSEAERTPSPESGTTEEQITEKAIVPEVCTSEAECAPAIIPSIPKVGEPAESTSIKPEEGAEKTEIPAGTTESNKIPETEEHTEETNEIPESGTEAIAKVTEVSSEPAQTEESSGETPTEAPAKEEEGSGEVPEEGSGATEALPGITTSPELPSKVKDQELTTGPEVTTVSLQPERPAEAEAPTTKLPQQVPSATERLPEQLGITEQIPEATPTVPESGLETTTYPEQTELPEREIPGEGSCLVDGQTYKNNSSVPPINHCQTSCRCVSSILRCESIECSPPPAGLQNCLPIFKSADSCCPTYSCVGSETTSPTEADSHVVQSTTPIAEEAETIKALLPEATEGPVEVTTSEAQPEEETSERVSEISSEQVPVSEEGVTEGAAKATELPAGPDEVTEQVEKETVAPISSELPEVTPVHPTEKVAGEGTEPSGTEGPEQITEVSKQPIEREKITTAVPETEAGKVTETSLPEGVTSQPATDPSTGDEEKQTEVVTHVPEATTEYAEVTQVPEGQTDKPIPILEQETSTGVSSEQPEIVTKGAPSGLATDQPIASTERAAEAEQPATEGAVTEIGTGTEVEGEVTALPEQPITEEIQTERAPEVGAPPSPGSTEGAVVTEGVETAGPEHSTKEPELRPDVTEISEEGVEISTAVGQPEVTEKSVAGEQQPKGTEQPEGEGLVTQTVGPVTEISATSEIPVESAEQTTLSSEHKEPSIEGEPKLSSTEIPAKEQPEEGEKILEGTETPEVPERQPSKEEELLTTIIPKEAEVPVEHVTVPQEIQPSKEGAEEQPHTTVTPEEGEEPVEHVTVPVEEMPTAKPIESESHVTIQVPTELETKIPEEQTTSVPKGTEQYPTEEKQPVAELPLEVITKSQETSQPEATSKPEEYGTSIGVTPPEASGTQTPSLGEVTAPTVQEGEKEPSETERPSPGAAVTEGVTRIPSVEATLPTKSETEKQPSSTEEVATPATIGEERIPSETETIPEEATEGPAVEGTSPIAETEKPITSSEVTPKEKPEGEPITVKTIGATEEPITEETTEIPERESEKEGTVQPSYAPETPSEVQKAGESTQPPVTPIIEAGEKETGTPRIPEEQFPEEGTGKPYIVEEGQTTVAGIEKGPTTVVTIEEGPTTVASVEEGQTSVVGVKEGQTTVTGVKEGPTTVAGVEEEGPTTVASVEEGQTSVGGVEEGPTTVPSVEEEYATTQPQEEPQPAKTGLQEGATTAVPSVEETSSTERLPEVATVEARPEQEVTVSGQTETPELPEEGTVVPVAASELPHPEQEITERSDVFVTTTGPSEEEQTVQPLPEKEGPTIPEYPGDEKEKAATTEQPTVTVSEEEGTSPAAGETEKPSVSEEESKTAIPSETEAPEGVTETSKPALPEDKTAIPEQPVTSKSEKPSIPEEVTTLLPEGVPVDQGKIAATEAPSEEETKEPEGTTAATPEQPTVSPDETSVSRKPLEEIPTFTSPEVTTPSAEEKANVSLPVRGELYTSGPEVEVTTKKRVPGELSTSAPVTEPTTILPATISTEEAPSHIPGEQVPEPGDYEDYEDGEQTAFGPGTCRYGGKVYVSAQQIPRDDPCDFCFCFRSDIICLQQSCPPPIPRCHEEPIRGFCCPRYECPVSMATAVNVTTSTTTTTTTLPPHFLSHAYKGRASKTGCQISGKAYKVGEVIRATSGPCLHCTCGGDGQMKCDPKPCSPEPMLRQMIAAAALRRRR